MKTTNQAGRSALRSGAGRREGAANRLERRGMSRSDWLSRYSDARSLQAAVGKSLLESSLSLIFSRQSCRRQLPPLFSIADHERPCHENNPRGSLRDALGIGAYVGTGQADAPKQAEQKKDEVKAIEGKKGAPTDDPLPAGSTLRFGTSRFRHGIPVSNMAVSADGKLAVAVNGNHVMGATRVFDLISGRALYAFAGWDGTSIEAAAISPDGKIIVTKQDFSCASATPPPERNLARSN